MKYGRSLMMAGEPIIILASVEDLSTYAAIIGGILGLVVAVVAFFVWARRRVRMRDPIRATFLIPQERYKNAHWPGGPPEELYPSVLRLAHHKVYPVAVRLTALEDIEVSELTLEFTNGEGELPRNRGHSHLRSVKRCRPMSGQRNTSIGMGGT